MNAIKNAFSKAKSFVAGLVPRFDSFAPSYA